MRCLCIHHVLAVGTRALPLIAAVCLFWYFMYRVEFHLFFFLSFFFFNFFISPVEAEVQ